MATPFVRLEPCTSGLAVSLALFGWVVMTLVTALFAFAARWIGANASDPMSLQRLMPLLLPLTVLLVLMKTRERSAGKYIRENAALATGVSGRSYSVHPGDVG